MDEKLINRPEKTYMRVDRETLTMLKAIGRKGQSYDDVIRMLIRTVVGQSRSDSRMRREFADDIQHREESETPRIEALPNQRFCGVCNQNLSLMSRAARRRHDKQHRKK